MDAATVADLGRELYELERDARSRAPLIKEHPDLTVPDAYAIQEQYASHRMNDGARLVGRKIGATSEAIQTLFGIDTPDFGHIFDDMVIEDGGSISRGQLVLPMVEPEIGFILDSPLEGPGVGREDVLAATRAVLPCLEIIDSRIHDWNIEFVDTVADNGSSARCVLGSPAQPVGDRDLAAITVEFRRNGEVIDRADGSAVLGHPADSVAWLANALGEFGVALREGEYVLSGSLTSAVRADAGDLFEARFQGLGDVTCRFDD